MICDFHSPDTFDTRLGERASANVQPCYVALTNKGDIVSIRYFIYSKKLNSVFALAQVVNLDNDCFIFSKAGHHILRVNETQDIVVIPICEIQEKLFFLKMSETLKFVIRMPNIHGHGLLK